jgi:hypothetical protein
MIMAKIMAVTTFLAILLTTGYAKAADSTKFVVLKFSPPDKVEYIRKVNVRKTFQFLGSNDQDVESSETEVESHTYQQRVKIRKARDRYILTVEPIIDAREIKRLTATQSNIYHGLAGLMRFTVGYKTSGEMIGFSGLKASTSAMKRELPKEIWLMLKPFIPIMIKNEELNWSGRFLPNLLGSPIPIGKYGRGINEVPLPAGGTAKYKVESTIQGYEQVGNIKCVDFRIAAEALDPDKFAGPLKDALTKVFVAAIQLVQRVEGVSERQVQDAKELFTKKLRDLKFVCKAQISGQQRWLDPSTMLTYYEMTIQTVLLEASIPGETPVSGVVTILNTIQYDYQQ